MKQNYYCSYPPPKNDSKSKPNADFIKYFCIYTFTCMSQDMKETMKNKLQFVHCTKHTESIPLSVWCTVTKYKVAYIQDS